jgi:hypothetical protein
MEPETRNAAALFVRCALGLALVACGRVGLDEPLDLTGTASAAGQGVAGGSGARGQVSAPMGMGIGGAAGTTPVVCAEGSTSCAGPSAVQSCVGGVWQPPFTCPVVGSCINGACVGGFNRVFITSETFAGGNLGGLDGADAICQKLAAAANLPGNYRAWLSDSTRSPATRFIKSGGPYELVDGSLVANDWTDLTSGALHHPINLTENGGTPHMTRICDFTAVYAWTGTGAAGDQTGPEGSCGDWTDTGSGSFLVGRGDVTDSTWSWSCGGTGNPTPDCGIYAAALYCFQQ